MNSSVYRDKWVRDYSVYYDESGVQEERREKVRLYPNKIGWHSVLSHGNYGPYGPTKCVCHVYTMAGR